MSIFDTVTKQRQEQAARHYAEYQGLLAKSVDGPAPSAKEAARLDELMGLLGFTVEVGKAHEQALREAKENQPIAAALPAAEATVAEIEGDIASFRADQDRATAQMLDRGNELARRMAAADAERARCLRAEDKLNELHHDHWRLFNLKNPALEAQKRHLVQSIYGLPVDSTYGVVEFEAAMSSPRAMAATFTNPSMAWVELPGQKPKDLARLLAEARRLSAGIKPAYYVLSDQDAARVTCNNGVVLIVPAEGKATTRVDTDDYEIVTAPGQTDAERDALLAKIAVKPRRVEAPEPALVGSGNAGRSDRNWVHPK